MVGLENEKFQDLVLNHLARLTQEMTGVKTDINDLKSDVKDLKESQQRMESRMDRLESKVDLIQTQTAELTELKTDTTGKLDQLIGDIEFIKHKEHLNEEELFKLKTNLQIVK
jgi:chromosome segregation ATPase